MKPVIGLTAAPNYRVSADKHIVNTPYVEAIYAAGGIPVIIPVSRDVILAKEYMRILDGLLIPGGEDITPLLYGEEPLAQVTYVNEAKDRLELELIHLAAEKGIPIFGICRGMQLLNIAFGGTLYQDIRAQTESTICHAQDMTIRGQTTHSVHVERESLIGSLLGAESLRVNSYHHQALRDPAPGFVVSATAPDGIIEAIENTAGNIYAVQWHPEELIGRCLQFLPLFQHLVKSAMAQGKN